MGISLLRPRFASLVGLSEVMFAVLAAWVSLGEAMTTIRPSAAPSCRRGWRRPVKATGARK